jgi:hypothetical protein
MMRDRYTYTFIKNEEEKIDESENCICGYKLRKDSTYVNNQNQLVSVMVCDSCGAVEHWVEPENLIESK